MRHLRVVKASVGAGVAVSAAAVLLTGCGNAVRNDPAAPAAPAASASPGAETRPTAQPAAAQSCPVSDPTAPQAPPTLIDSTPANTPEGERISQAVGAQGRGAFADVYSTQIVDHPVGRVALCVTDLAHGRLLVDAAHAADPEADPARVDLYLSAYSRRTLDGVADRLILLQAGFPIYTVSGDHGAGVEVTTNAEGARSAEFKAELAKAAGGVPVTVTKGEEPRSLVGEPTTAP
ncbi:hypothetical protein OG389_02355 [Streptomyces sp. NBC_00435]|uniref:hypothetical protein n=1 Tax=Streptomyces sp. NBC_00435 TaxID=2903649 RepID=UPI002E1C5D23